MPTEDRRLPAGKYGLSCYAFGMLGAACRLEAGGPQRLISKQEERIMTKVASKRGSSNVFADLLIADSDTHLLKAQLVARFQEVIRAKRITQARTAELIGVSQPDVSRILRGQFRDVSVERAWCCFLRGSVAPSISS